VRETETTRGRRKTMIGIVVSTKMDKTAVVAVERRHPHRLYHKIVTVTKRYKAHDPNNSAVLGDVVRIMETRPLSREKRWRIAQTLTRGNVAEIAPTEIGASEQAEWAGQRQATEEEAMATEEGATPAETENEPEAGTPVTTADAAADEGVQVESEVLQAAADDMDPEDYEPEEEEEKA
jgi:small subunit ribosomal protein S17